jgi:predicted ATPase
MNKMLTFAFSKIKYMDSVEIHGYKSIKNQKIDLTNINILIGANGSGKSNFLSFFEFLNRLCDRKISEYIALKGGADKILHNGSKITEEISFVLEFQKGADGYSAVLKSGNDGFVFTEELLMSFDKGSVDISTSDREANLKIDSQRSDRGRSSHIVEYMNGLRKYHFHDTGTQSPLKKMSNIKNDIHYLYEKGDNLAAFLYNIRQENAIVYNRIVSVIQSVAPYFFDFFLQPNVEGFLYLQWKDKYGDVVYGVNDLSDGTLRFIALTVLFMQPKLPDTVIIDEPELGLHPAAIAKLAGMIKSASSECQVILSTQSAELISHFKPEDIITVDQIDGETKFKRLNSEELSTWLEDYTLDDLWKRSIITTGQPNY